jgi:hypothetical protein
MHNILPVNTNDITHHARGSPVISYERFLAGESVRTREIGGKNVGNMTFFGL